MCEHCGCRGVEPIEELMEEHFDLLGVGARLRAAVAGTDHAETLRVLDELRTGLLPHAAKEERGIFAALRASGEFVDAVDALEAEHASFDAMIEELRAQQPGSPAFRDRVHRLLDELGEHIDQENLGIFPVAVVTLGAAGWELVTRAHEGVAAGRS